MCKKCDMDAEFKGYSFVSTEEGNFLVAARAEYDEFIHMITGYTVGERVASIAVMHVGDISLPSREDFIQFIKEDGENLVLLPTYIQAVYSKEEHDALVATLAEGVKMSPGMFKTPISDEEYSAALYDKVQVRDFGGLF